MLRTFPKLLAITAFGCLFLASNAKALCTDPWINQGVQQIMGRPPIGSVTSGECNKMLYGMGQWSSYQDLLNKIAVSSSVRFVSGVGGKCLDVENDARINGTRLIGWGCANEGAQFFLYRPGVHRILDHMGYNKCLTIEGGVRKAGAQIILYDCNGGANQVWTYLSDGRIMAGNGIVEPATYCIDLEGGNLSPAYWVPYYHQRTVLWNCNGGANQNWYFTKQAPSTVVRVMAGQAGTVTMGTGVGGVAGGTIVAQGGGNLVNTNGSNIVAQGAGNIVAQGGGNIVAQGAGN